MLFPRPRAFFRNLYYFVDTHKYPCYTATKFAVRRLTVSLTHYLHRCRRRASHPTLIGDAISTAFGLQRSTFCSAAPIARRGCYRTQSSVVHSEVWVAVPPHFLYITVVTVLSAKAESHKKLEGSNCGRDRQDRFLQDLLGAGIRQSGSRA